MKTFQHVLKSEIMNFYKELTRFRYNIGFISSESDTNLISRETNDAHVDWLDWNGYKGGWFADPFILFANDKIIEVLVEEWIDKKEKGHISKLIVDRATKKLLNVVPLLDNTTHFSFPNIWREDGKIFVYPENYQSGGLYIYEYDEENERLLNSCCLINEPLLDAQLLNYNGQYYIFAVRQDNGPKQSNILYVYNSLTLKGKYTLIQTIENPLKEERGAGAIIVRDNQIIRPAQSCEVDYGYSMVFYELSCKDDRFVEREIGRIYPNPKQRWNRKIHTYNRFGNIVAVDGFEYKHRYISNMYRAIKVIIQY